MKILAAMILLALPVTTAACDPARGMQSCGPRGACGAAMARAPRLAYGMPGRAAYAPQMAFGGYGGGVSVDVNHQRAFLPRNRGFSASVRGGGMAVNVRSGGRASGGCAT